MLKKINLRNPQKTNIFSNTEKLRYIIDFIKFFKNLNFSVKLNIITF